MSTRRPWEARALGLIPLVDWLVVVAGRAKPANLEQSWTKKLRHLKLI